MTTNDQSPHGTRALLRALIGSTALLLPVAGFAATPERSTLPQTVAADTGGPGGAQGGSGGAQGGSDAAKGALGSSDAAAPASDAAAPKSAETSTDKSAMKSRAETANDRRQADRKAFFDAHLAALHAGLTLKSDQESLWAPVESGIRGLAKTAGQRRTREEIVKLLHETPIDLLHLRSEQLIQRGEAINHLLAATEPLLDSLTDEQKGRLPELLNGLGPSIVLRAAFNVRSGRVLAEDDGETSAGADDEPTAGEGGEPGFNRRTDRSYEHRRYHDEHQDADGDTDRGDHYSDDQDERPMRPNHHRQHEDSDSDT